MSEQNIRCPKCGSYNVERHLGTKLLKGGAEILGGFLEGYFFGGSGDIGGKIAGELVSPKYECNNCGNMFKEDEISTNNISHYSCKGPFDMPEQNQCYHELKDLSQSVGGFSQSDYRNIIKIGEKYGLSDTHIYMIAMQCSWRCKRPTSEQLFTYEDPKSKPKIQSNVTTKSNNMNGSNVKYEILPFNSTYQNILYAELFYRSYNKGGFVQEDFNDILRIGESYGLNPNEILQVAQKCIWKSTKV